MLQLYPLTVMCKRKQFSVSDQFFLFSVTVNFKSCGFNSSLNLNICHQVTVTLSFKCVYSQLSCAGCKHLCLAEVKLCNSFKEVELFVSCHQLEVRPVNENCDISVCSCYLSSLQDEITHRLQI